MFKQLAPLTLILSVLAGCGAPIATPTSIAPPSRQGMVDEVRALTEDLVLPEHLRVGDSARTGEEFDANQYFAVLDHLSMEDGYALDYVYRREGSDGEPVLYARREDRTRYSTYSEYVATLGPLETAEDLERVWYAYLEHVRVDDTEDGFYQFVLLRILGGQFYLLGRGNYNDLEVVANRAGLARILMTPSATGPALPIQVQQRVRTLDPTPVVQMEEGAVLVRVILFTQWGGFLQMSFAIQREFPHSILHEELVTLVPYDSGAMP